MLHFIKIKDIGESKKRNKQKRAMPISSSHVLKENNLEEKNTELIVGQK